MTAPRPLPMSPLTPCAVCRRRIRVGGKPVFDTCFCLRHGRAATVTTLAATGLLFAALAVLVARQRR